MEHTTIGGYLIERKLGEGGMGVVYLARHPRLNRTAVIKMLRRELADNPEIAKRFENEANAAASIGHPGIVDVYDIGHTEYGSLYIVMEQLGGESLQTRLDRVGVLPAAQAVGIITHCADALSAAHERGIVHRDLKPDNIFLVPDALVAGGERAKLLDFGIAKLAGDASVMTQTGAMMGTPLYMSPEQCQGAGGVDHRTDLYALGCILFQMLAGKPPFAGNGVGDYIVAHMTKPAPRVRSLAPAVSAELEQVIDVLLAKKPDDRFASARALIEALATVGSPLPEVSPVGPTFPSRNALPATDAGTAATLAPSAQVAVPLSTGASSLGVPGSSAGGELRTTLTSSAGQVAPAPASEPITARPRRSRWLPIGGAVAVLGAGAVFVMMRTGESPARPDAGVPAAVPVPRVPIAAAPDPRVESKRAAWLERIDAAEHIRGNSYPWSGEMRAVGDQVELSIELAEKGSGKDQRLACNVRFGSDGNPSVLPHCKTLFSDKGCPQPQSRNTEQVEVTCGPLANGAGFECVTGDILIALCRTGWHDSKTVFAVRRRLLVDDKR